MNSDQGQGRGCAYLVAIVLSGLLAAVKYASGATYTVGDSAGWNTGVDYTAWAKKYTFVQGDTLVFNYFQGLHSVNQVSQADYQGCNLNNVLKAYNSGSDSVTLSASSEYFVCGTAGHCQQGMKVAIVTSSSTNSTPITPPSSGSSGSPSTGGRTPSAYAPNHSQAPSLQLSASASILFTMAAGVTAFFL